MAIATSTAIALAIGAGTAGAQVYGAKKAASASKQAAQLQADAAQQGLDVTKQATDDALKFQREQWEYGKQALAPYQQVGTQALGTLGNLMGFSGARPHAQGMGQPIGGGTLGSLGTYAPPQLPMVRDPVTGQMRPVSPAQAARLRAQGM